MINQVTQGFDSNRLKVPEELEMDTAIKTEIERFTPAVLDLTALAPHYYSAVNRFDLAVKVDRASALTPVIDTIHDKLVQSYAGLSHGVAGVELSLSDSDAADGRTLRRILGKYAFTQHDNYKVAADNTHNLVEDLEDDDIAVLTAKYHLATWVTGMKALVASFRELLGDRFEQIAALPVGETKAARLQCRRYRRAALQRVNSQIYDAATPTSKFIQFADTLRGIFANYKLVAHSPGHHEGGGTGGGTGGGGSVIHPVDEEWDGEDGGL